MEQSVSDVTVPPADAPLLLKRSCTAWAGPGWNR
jgi:hypothetical protein